MGTTGVYSVKINLNLESIQWVIAFSSAEGTNKEHQYEWDEDVIYYCNFLEGSPNYVFFSKVNNSDGQVIWAKKIDEGSDLYYNIEFFEDKVLLVEPSREFVYMEKSTGELWKRFTGSHNFTNFEIKQTWYTSPSS